MMSCTTQGVPRVSQPKMPKARKPAEAADKRESTRTKKEKADLSPSEQLVTWSFK